MKLDTKLGLVAASLAAGVLFTAGGAVLAADHIDSPNATADSAADITDYYAWADTETTVAIVAFAGLAEAGSDGTYDRDVLYGIHFDQDGDGVSDHDIWVRFGPDADGNWGVQASGLGGDPLEGPVGEAVTGKGTQVWAGPRDDPFFFDFEGFQGTLDSGTLMFDSTRDFFAGLNVTAIAVEVPTSVVSGGGAFTTWATTRR